MQWPGLLVALEGIDGAGTTTQLAPLAAALTAQGHACFATCEPSNSPCGQLARRYLRAPEQADEATMALLFAADRLMHVQRELLPRLHAGQIVLCDRYLLSSLAYQTTGDARLSAAWVAGLNAQAPPADLTLWFAVAPAVAKARRLVRGGVAERFDDDDRQSRVHAAYRRHAAAMAARGEPVVTLDASAAIDALTRQASACIHAKMAERAKA